MASTIYCGTCEKSVQPRKEFHGHVIHAILSLLTLGFWLLFWLLLAVLGSKWVCPVCKLDVDKEYKEQLKKEEFESRADEDNWALRIINLSVNLVIFALVYKADRADFWLLFLEERVSIAWYWYAPMIIGAISSLGGLGTFTLLSGLGDTKSSKATWGGIGGLGQLFLTGLLLMSLNYLFWKLLPDEYVVDKQEADAAAQELE